MPKRPWHWGPQTTRNACLSSPCSRVYASAFLLRQSFSSEAPSSLHSSLHRSENFWMLHLPKWPRWLYQLSLALVATGGATNSNGPAKDETTQRPATIRRTNFMTFVNDWFAEDIRKRVITVDCLQKSVSMITIRPYLYQQRRWHEVKSCWLLNNMSVTIPPPPPLLPENLL